MPIVTYTIYVIQLLVLLVEFSESLQAKSAAIAAISRVSTEPVLLFPNGKENVPWVDRISKAKVVYFR